LKEPPPSPTLTSMRQQTFQALTVREAVGNQFIREIISKNISDLPANDVLINVLYSSLNYKDALSATGHKGVTKNYPHTPGIDAAGIVIESNKPEFKKGDQVIVTGFDLGMNTPGGFGQYIRVPAQWIVKLSRLALPRRQAGGRQAKNLSLKESMIFGTAGLTAALSLVKLEQMGLNAAKGEVLVTGATGSVGSTAVAILAQIGYHVVAATGKTHEKNFLLEIGAKKVIDREQINDTSGKPLLKERWAGVIDTVGGNILSTAIKSTQYGGSVSCCGLVASHDLHSTIYPFILRGVNLLGIASAEAPIEMKRHIWHKLSTGWKPDCLDRLYTECSLKELEPKIDAMLKGNSTGRTVVNLKL